MPLVALPLAVVNMFCVLLGTSRSFSEAGFSTSVSHTPAGGKAIEATQASGDLLHFASFLVCWMILALSATEQESHRNV